MSTQGATIECGDCGWEDEFDTRIEHGPYEGDDETFIVNEPETCPNCGSDDLHVFIHGLCIRDEGREDFHSDG